MTDLLINYLHSQVSLDVCQRAANPDFDELHTHNQTNNTSKPLDYQQQINLYKKYTELKKHPNITQSQEFNRRISVVFEKAGGGPANRTKSSDFHTSLSSGQSAGNIATSSHNKTRSAIESSTPVVADKNMTSDGGGKKAAKSKSQSTNYIDKQESMSTFEEKTTNENKTKTNRAVSQSPKRSSSSNVRQNEQAITDGPSSSSTTSGEGKRTTREDDGKKTKSNGFIKRLSMRFRSLSIENNTEHGHGQHKPERTDSKKLKRTDSEKKKEKSKEEIYSEQYSNHVNREKAIRDAVSVSNNNTSKSSSNNNSKTPSAPSVNNHYYPVNYNVTSTTNSRSARLQTQNSNDIDIESEFI